MRRFYMVYARRQLPSAQAPLEYFSHRKKAQTVSAQFALEGKGRTLPVPGANKTMVRITLPEGANIHAREYQLYLPSKAQFQQKLVEWTAAHPAEEK